MLVRASSMEMINAIANTANVTTMTTIASHLASIPLLAAPQKLSIGNWAAAIPV